MPTWSIPSDSKMIEVDGYPMTYTEVGSGTPLILLHGILFDSRVFSSQIQALSSDWRVLAPNLRHYYPEPWSGSGGNYSIEQHAKDVISMIETLKLEKAHLLGWSRGGIVALEMAKSLGPRVRTLILEEAAFPAPEVPQVAIPGLPSLEELRQMFQTDLSKGDLTFAVEKLVDGMNHPGYWSRLRPEHQRIALDNVHTVSGDRERPSTTSKDLKAFDFPVLALSGDKSHPVFRSRLQLLQESCRNFTKAQMSGSGHLMHSENPALFNKIVSDFLSKN